MEQLISKINGYLKELDEIGSREDKRRELSNKIMGFIESCFGQEKLKYYRNNYLQVSGFIFDENEITKKKIENMRNFLLRLREEIEVKNMLNIPNEPEFDNIIKKAGDIKNEAERRKNVFDMKYWGFAIEAIEAVRKELKEFRTVQEELLKAMKELKEEIKNIKNEAK